MPRRARMPEDHGGMAVLIGVLFMAVFVAFTALVVDAGAAFQERRELQNAADAGALAIAYACARGEEDCDAAPSGTAWALAETLADENASDGMATVTDIRYEGNEVTVETESRNAEGAHFFQWLVEFSRNGIFGDADDIDPITVVASATVALEPVGGGNTLPLTFSMCEWDKYFDEDDYVEPPLPAGFGTIIHLHEGTGQQVEDCNGVAGQDYAGGFGWLESPDQDCNTDVTVDEWAPAETGNFNPKNRVGCDSDFFDELIDNEVEILVPLFSETNDHNGSNAAYWIEGFAVGYLTGYHFSGMSSSPAPCSGGARCLSAYFTDFVPLNAVGGGNENFGATIPRLSQ